MSTTEQEQEQGNGSPNPNKGRYVVLKELTHADEIATAVTEGSRVWLELTTVDARNNKDAIRDIAVGDSTVHEGTYVGVSAASFQPREVKQVVQISMG